MPPAVDFALLHRHRAAERGGSSRRPPSCSAHRRRAAPRRAAPSRRCAARAPGDPSRLTTTSRSPSPSRSAAAIACEMSSSVPKRHVRARVLERHVAAIAEGDVLELERRELPAQSLPGDVASAGSAAAPATSASMMSHRWPLATRMSCQPSRSTSDEHRRPRPAARLHARELATPRRTCRRRD